MSEPGRHWSFLIAAGGSGSRLGGQPKQFRMLGSRPMWRWSFDVAERLCRAGIVEDIVLVVPDSLKNNIAADVSALGITLVSGGRTRGESIIRGLEQCRGRYVLAHDGARPFVTYGLCRRLVEAVDGMECGAVPLLPSADSLKTVADEKIGCVDRSLYFRTQTPQAFPTGLLYSVLKSAGGGFTDEASAWSAAGKKLVAVEGEERNFKITTQFDWETACSLSDGYIERRTGHGYDIHQLKEGRKLIIAGVEVESGGFGLFGHSDADIVTHTVMDALLGAAGEPDIGTLFPASETKWSGADSIELLHIVLDLLASKGWRIEWIDVTLNAQRPRLGHMVPAFIEKLNEELTGSGGNRVFNMKVKSAEHCGSPGRGECMICHGVATISRVNVHEYPLENRIIK